MIVYIYNIGVDLYNGFNGLRHRINWTYFTVLDGLAHPLYSVCENYTLSIEKLIECHVDRVLTSAQKRTVLEAKEEIKYIIDTYGEKIEILPGGSINIDNVSEIVNYTHTNQIHSSCKDFHQDHTTSYGDISYSYLDGTDNYECVSLIKVKELKKRLDNLKK